MVHSVTISSNTFWGTPFQGPPFLEKAGPSKITEGGPFDPHWPISRIKPATFIMIIPTHLLCQM